MQRRGKEHLEVIECEKLTSLPVQFPARLLYWEETAALRLEQDLLLGQVISGGLHNLSVVFSRGRPQ